MGKLDEATFSAIVNEMSPLACTAFATTGSAYPTAPAHVFGVRLAFSTIIPFSTLSVIGAGSSLSVGVMRTCPLRSTIPRLRISPYSSACSTIGCGSSPRIER